MSHHCLLVPKKRLDIIWNHTAVCTQDCADCCVDAVHAYAKGTNAVVRSVGLMRVDIVPMRPDEGKYAAAQRHQQTLGRELSFEQKMMVLRNLDGFDVRLDISGGDALVTPDGIRLLRACSERAGRENVTLTVTGAGLRPSDIDEVTSLISELNFTFNAAEPEDAVSRPRMYAAFNLKMAARVVAHGLSVRAECPLLKGNCDPDHLRRLYLQLRCNNVPKLLVMRQFAVGRGQNSPQLVPSRDEYISAIRCLFELEARYGGPKVKLQCALRHMAAIEGLIPDPGVNPCDAVRESYGLMPDGTLLASPWAIGPTGQPLDPSWVIGNLAESTLAQLLRSRRAQAMMFRADENFGHCKIFAFQHSIRPDSSERMFDKVDPLANKIASSGVGDAVANSLGQ
ncbi:hypothetical protein [Burkholderia ubonensis]|uniref:hypothetical protein n=1 Tax=Burkholderia ubonensis TaxID=101571 RepID=UPI000AD558FB|nr:hypothetical protein [Burkholderia ubonensis]